MNASRVGLKDNRVGFLAGFAGSFGFYVATMFVSVIWQTATVEDATIKSVIGLILGLVVGVVLYLGVNSRVNKNRETTNSNRITRYAIWGIVAGLVIAFFFGMLFYDPTGLGPAPVFPLKPLFPLN